MTGPGVLTCATWNIHRGRGNDGVIDPVRTARTLVSEVWRLGLDALVLTEADEEAHPHRGLLDLDALQAETGLRHAHPDLDHRFGPHSHGFHGILVLVAPGIVVEEVRLLDLPGIHHRGAVVLDATKDGRSLRLIGTHLSLGQPARIAQTRTIGQHLRRRPARQTILAGDLNEWRPWGGLALSQLVVGTALSGPSRASFPTGWPVLPLDRVLASAPAAVSTLAVLDGPGIRATSDHRPVRAEIMLG